MEDTKGIITCASDMGMSLERFLFLASIGAPGGIRLKGVQVADLARQIERLLHPPVRYEWEYRLARLYSKGGKDVWRYFDRYDGNWVEKATSIGVMHKPHQVFQSLRALDAAGLLDHVPVKIVPHSEPYLF